MLHVCLAHFSLPACGDVTSYEHIKITYIVNYIKTESKLGMVMHAFSPSSPKRDFFSFFKY